jgi:hypothetical protein
MPPRYAYWTILIDNQATAFRAREKDELLPTLTQLRRTNKDVVLKWFARGRIWESREAEIAAREKQREKRARDWRPGGTHEDSRKRWPKRRARRPASPQQAAHARRSRDRRRQKKPNDRE